MIITHEVLFDHYEDLEVPHVVIAYDESCGLFIGLTAGEPVTAYGNYPGDIAQELQERNGVRCYILTVF